MAPVNSRPILVVGAGPTGLTMASELARHGIACRIIEKAAQPSDKSRALAIHTRTLEMLDDMGAVFPFLEAGRKIHALNLYENGHQTVHFGLDGIASYYNFSLICPQNLTEKFLSQHLQSFGIPIERDVELIALRQNQGKVQVSLRKADGSIEESEYDYVVGADGAHSAVRHNLAIGFAGIEIAETFLLADVCLSPNLPGDQINLFVTAHGMLGIFPIAEGLSRVIVNLSEGTELENPTLAEIQGFVDKRSPFKMTVSDPQWLAAFAIHSRQAEAFSVGSVFLAGDAAHIHSPAGGQGMNTGMQDAYNLAWKLALTVKGYAKPILLDSYAIERRPVAAKVLASTEMLTKLNISSKPLVREMRNHIVPFLAHLEFVQEQLRNEISELSVCYKDSPITGEYHKRPAIFSLSGTSPNPREWVEFAVGPMPGERAPDNTCYEDNVDTRVYQVIRDTFHNLFLFTGHTVSKVEFQEFKDIAAMIKRDYGQLIKTHLVVAGETDIEELRLVDFVDTVLSDPDLSMHQRWGADFASLYLLRPDNYVGFRSQPPELPHLRAYLERIFQEAQADMDK